MRIKSKYRKVLLNIICFSWFILVILLASNNSESLTVYVLSQLLLFILFTACSIVIIACYGDYNE